MFVDRVIHFGQTLDDHVKGRSPQKLKSSIEVPNVVHMKVHVRNLNLSVISSPKLVLAPIHPFTKDFGNQVKGGYP